MSLSQFFKPKYLLCIICLLFLFSRLYKISEIPVSVYWDEASIGVNAYSIALTGKDEWGESFPLHFRAFGEFKLPVYIYSVSTFVKIFGLNEFSVRFPAVLFSLGVVVLTYFLAKKISGNPWIGIFSSFFVSISPWFFIFSRTGYEATAGLMFYLLGIHLFLSMQKNSWFLLVSVITFIFSMYSYNSFRVLVPFTILILLFLEQKLFSKKIIIPAVLSLFIIILVTIPIYRLYTYDAGAARLRSVGGVDMAAFLKNYVSHFSPGFLLQGDKNLRSQQKDFGQIYFPDLILFILGLLYICKKSKFASLPVLLLLLAPIPAAITKESPHALRAIAMVPFISIISAFGLFQLKNYLHRKYLVEFITVVLFLLFFSNYFFNFLTIYPRESSAAWQYGYKQVFDSVPDNNILVSDKDGQPYIFALFYLKYDPEKFRSEVVRNSVDKWGTSTVKSFGKYEFNQ